MLVGLWCGQWLDRKLGTDGWFTGLGLALGLTAGVRSVYTLVRDTQRALSRHTTAADPDSSDPNSSDPNSSDPDSSDPDSSDPDSSDPNY